MYDLFRISAFKVDLLKNMFLPTVSKIEFGFINALYAF
jgi:hypothetical protein